MGSHILFSPPAKTRLVPSRKSTSKSKSAKSGRRISKHASANAYSVPQNDDVARAAGTNRRCQRVPKACERCRVKKTKCDGEFPCKRCKDDGLVCTAGVRKKVQYRKLPARYAEVLESTQFTLVATIHKLYNMVRNSQVWELGEPDLNDRGLPVIHDIAQKLGYIREISDINLPTPFVFPEDEAAMGVLAQRLEDQHEKDMDSQEDLSSAPVLDHSKLEDFWTTPLGKGTITFLSPQSFECSNDFEFSLVDPEIDCSVNFTSLIPSVTNFSTEYMPKSQTSGMVMEFVPKRETLQDIAKINHSIVNTELRATQPDNLSCSNLDVMVDMAYPIIYGKFQE